MSFNFQEKPLINFVSYFQITLVSLLAAVASAAPEAQIGHLGLGYGLGGGVVSATPAACTPSTEEIEIQSCAPSADTVCVTNDIASEEIEYEKRYPTYLLQSQTLIHFGIFEQVL